jgi:hypothetical protein
MENSDANQKYCQHAVKEYHRVRPAEKPHRGSNPRLSAEFQRQAGEGQSHHTGSGQKMNPAMQRIEAKDRVVQSPAGHL